MFAGAQGRDEMRSDSLDLSAGRAATADAGANMSCNPPEEKRAMTAPARHQRPRPGSATKWPTSRALAPSSSEPALCRPPSSLCQNSFRMYSAGMTDRTTTASSGSVRLHPPDRNFGRNPLGHEKCNHLNPLAKGLYRVISGQVPMRSAPDDAAELLGYLRGGHRFYGTPCQFGKSSWWIKLETENVHPPVFSPKHIALIASAEADPSSDLFERLHLSSVPRILSPAPDLEFAEDIWVRFDEQNVVRHRDDRRRDGIDGRHEGDDAEAPGIAIAKAWRRVEKPKRRRLAHEMALESLRREGSAWPRHGPDVARKIPYADPGNGAWLNFQIYGPLKCGASPHSYR
eukprot:gnl/TRDRNA2_/TRDRNA2_113002_c1_seq1.p1 gnl/TRDRNA2_/TRDRNA2_113002_c1~~gnl/TRDRNA2_/TRDRNA2_113002_c1_seq1.p1  ORF type:complete len:344 (+),score=39.23 gnl/TRDRNA2_/TRDRNA2_113002_c1_seq1:80-1111(+)